MSNDTKSNRPFLPPTVMAALAAFGGAALVAIPRPGDKPVAVVPPAPTAQAAADSPAYPPPGAEDPGPLSVLYDLHRYSPEKRTEKPVPFWQAYFKGDELRVGQVTPPGAKRRDLADVLKEYQPDADYEFLIATVPDPIDSKFAVDFDAALESLQRAFAARGFILQSSWLPWPRVAPGTPAAGGRATTAVATRPRYREVPGTLLFRFHRTRESQTRLVYTLVCLVGENPMSGVHKPALTEALNTYEKLDGALTKAGMHWSCEQPRGVVPIVGPSFTGFQSALAKTLTVWADTCGRSCTRFRIVSGGATAVTPKKFFDTPAVTFQATVIPSPLVQRAVLCYLGGQRGRDLPDEAPDLGTVAILRESNTAYGLSESVKRVGTNSPWIDLPFPISVSQFEVDLGKLEDQRPDPAPLPAAWLGPRFPVRDVPQLDGVTPFDRESAAALAGQELRAILAVIHREKVRYVGIQATDPHDVVFLNKLLRRHCPNVRVFATEPGLAFSDPAEASHMRGMVVGSTYPLFPQTQRWPGPVSGADDKKPSPWDVRLAFPAQGAQGRYNAVLAQFGDYKSMLDYRPVVGDPEEEARPPIWVSVVGQGGALVPVHTFSRYTDAVDLAPPCRGVPPNYVFRVPYAKSLSPEGDDSRPGTGVPYREEGRGIRLPAAKPFLDVSAWLLLTHAAAIALVGLAIAAVVWPAWREDYLGGGAEPAPFGWVWRGVLLAAVLLFALPHSLAALELFDPCCESGGRPGGLVAWSAVFVTLGIAGLSGSLIARYWWRPADGTANHYCVLGVAAGLVALRAWYVWSQVPGPERFFLYVRAIEAAAAVSTLTPVVILSAAAFILGWFSLRQAELRRWPWLGCPLPKGWEVIRNEDARTRAVLKSCHPTTVVGWLVLAGVAPIAIYRGLWDLPGREVGGWDEVVWFAVLLTSVGVVLTLVRLVEMWLRLSALLVAINRLPMAHVFETLPDAARRTFNNLSLVAGRPQLKHLRVAVWSLPAVPSWSLLQDTMAGRPTLNWLFARPGPAANDPPARSERDELKWLSGHLTKEARSLVPALNGPWGHRSVDEVFGTNTPAAEAPRPAELLAPSLMPIDTSSPAKSGEQFVAIAIMLYLGAYLAQLRVLMYAAAFPAPLIMFAVASYPFEPERPRLDLQAGLVAAAAAVILYILVAINRNPLLSRVARTRPDRFTPDSGFLTSTGTYVVPLLAVVLGHTFGVFRAIIDPILGLIR